MRLLLLVLIAATAAASEARLVLPESFPPGTPVLGVIAVVDAGRTVARIELPAVDGLTWERIGGSEVQHVIANGVARMTERHRLRLTAAHAGTLAIPPIVVHLQGGTRLETAARIALVQPGDPRLVGEAVCWAEFSPATAIVGQTVTLRMTCAFADDSFQIERVGLEPPAEATVLGSSDDGGERYGADGRRWRTLTRRWTLTFAEPGTVRVRGQQEYVPCERFVTGWVALGPARRMAIGEAVLQVRPVPAGGRPEGWNGLVGPVTAEATLERERIALGEGTRLSLRVRGSTAGLLARPPLPPVAGLEARARDESGERAGDERTFTWDLRPAAAGSYAVTSPAIAYYDAASDTFRALRAPAPTLVVEPGTAAPMTIAGAAVPAAVADVPATAPGMPAPRRGHAAQVWPPATLLAVVALAALVTALVGVAARWRPRPRRAHRGRALAAALRAGDLAAAARCAAALRADLPADLDAAADDFERELAAVRFGGMADTRLRALAAPLERLP